MDRGWVSFRVFVFCALVFCSITFSVPLFSWLEHDGCSICFFIFTLFSLSLVLLTRSHCSAKSLKKTCVKVQEVNLSKD